MAGLILYVNSGEVTLAAATPKTVLQIKAPANQRGKLRAVKILGKAPAGGTDTPLKLRLTRSTANFGTGTSVSAPAKQNPSNPETPQSAFATNFTVEPTTPADAGLWWEIQPQSGVIEFIPPGLESEVPGGQALNFEATSTGTPTLIVTVTYEE